MITCGEIFKSYNRNLWLEIKILVYWIRRNKCGIFYKDGNIFLNPLEGF